MIEACPPCTIKTLAAGETVTLLGVAAMALFGAGALALVLWNVATQAIWAWRERRIYASYRRVGIVSSRDEGRP